MNKTNEEQFNDIMSGLGFELRKAEDGGYFVYDNKSECYRPPLDEVIASEDLELGSKAAGSGLDIERGEDGVCRIVYYGDNRDYATLFNATPEERANELADLAEKCELDVDEIINFLTCDSAEEVVEMLDTFVVDDYLQDIADICSNSPLMVSEPATFDDALALEKRLEAAKDTDKYAKDLLDSCKQDFDDIRFLQNGISSVNIDKAYELQETGKEPQKNIAKAKQDIERD